MLFLQPLFSSEGPAPCLQPLELRLWTAKHFSPATPLWVTESRSLQPTQLSMLPGHGSRSLASALGS